jgi:hypothetical protein
MDKNLLSFVLGGIVLALLIFIGYQNYASSEIQNIVPENEIGEKTVDFIKNNLASPDTEFSVLGVGEANGVYEIKFNVMGQEDTAYVTKNGKYLFFQPFDMLPPEPQTFNKTDKPDVGLYVMSFCPYGNQSEELMMPVVELLGDRANIELHYVIYSDYSSGYPEYCLDEESKYCSMHGVQEVNQGIRELCVQKYQKDKLWGFVKAINDNSTYEDVDSKWEGIAQGLGIDVAQIKTCELDEGIALLSEELNLTEQQYPVQDPSKHESSESAKIAGSPTITINGMIFDGERSADGYKEAICSAMTNPISECEQVIEDQNAAADGSCE